MNGATFPEWNSVRMVKEKRQAMHRMILLCTSLVIWGRFLVWMTCKTDIYTCIHMLRVMLFRNINRMPTTINGKVFFSFWLFSRSAKILPLSILLKSKLREWNTRMTSHQNYNNGNKWSVFKNVMSITFMQVLWILKLKVWWSAVVDLWSVWVHLSFSLVWGWLDTRLLLPSSFYCFSAWHWNTGN